MRTQEELNKVMTVEISRFDPLEKFSAQNLLRVNRPQLTVS